MPMRDLRRSYEMKALNREDLHPHPIEQFRTWFDGATQGEWPDWLEPNAMTLATYDVARSRVDARIVLLKHVDERGFMFFTNYLSEKGQQMAAHSSASLVFYWPHMEQQVRIRGQIAKTDRQTSEHYFHSRPRSSQLGAAASSQSRALVSREELEGKVQELAAMYENREVPCPTHWGGYILAPDEIEFWQGRSDRLHDRFLYQLQSNRVTWEISRLSP